MGLSGAPCIAPVPPAGLTLRPKVGSMVRGYAEEARDSGPRLEWGQRARFPSKVSTHDLLTLENNKNPTLKEKLC